MKHRLQGAVTVEHMLRVHSVKIQTPEMKRESDQSGLAVVLNGGEPNKFQKLINPTVESPNSGITPDLLGSMPRHRRINRGQAAPQVTRNQLAASAASRIPLNVATVEIASGSI